MRRQPTMTARARLTAGGAVGLVLWAMLAVLAPAAVPALVIVPVCSGDCDRDGAVSIAELITGVAIALTGDGLAACTDLDADGSGAVSISELIAAVAAAADGCPPAPITLSAGALPPGAMLAISHPSIRAGVPLPVSFRGARGFEVAVTTPLTEDGVARVAVPPFLDLGSAGFAAGEVTVAIAGAAGPATLQIEALPEVGVAPGVLTSIVLGEAVNRLGFAEEGANLFERDTGLASATLAEGLRQASKFTVELGVELEGSGHITLGTPTGAAVLEDEHLALLDRLLAAPILAAAALPSGPGAARGAALTAPPTTAEGWAEVVEETKRKGIPGMQVLGSYVSVLTGVVGLVAAAVPGGQPLAGVAAVAAVASTGLVTIGSAMASIAADLTIDALRGRDPDLHQAGVNATDVVVGGLRSIGLTALGAVEWAGTTLVNMAGFGSDLRDGANSLRDLYCATEDAPRGLLGRGASDPFCRVPPTATPIPTATPTRARTATATRTRTATSPRTATAAPRTATPRPSATATRPGATATRTAAPSATATAARTATPTRTPSTTRSPSPTRTAAAAFRVLFWRNTNGATGMGAAGAQLQLGGQRDFPTITLAASLGGAQQLTVGVSGGALLYGIVAGPDENDQPVPIRGPVRYGDYGIPDTLPLFAGPAPALRAGVDYVAVATPLVFTGGTASIVFRVGD